jgi:hypothetical protein
MRSAAVRRKLWIAARCREGQAFGRSSPRAEYAAYNAFGRVQPPG